MSIIEKYDMLTCHFIYVETHISVKNEQHKLTNSLLTEDLKKSY